MRRRQIIMLIVDGRRHRRHVRATLRRRQPARARPRPPGRHLDRAVPGEGHRPRPRSTPRSTSSATASTASASPSPRCSARATRSSSTCPGVKDREKAEEHRRPDRRAAVPAGAVQTLPVGMPPIPTTTTTTSRARRDDHDRRRRRPRRAPPAVDGERPSTTITGSGRRRAHRSPTAPIAARVRPQRPTTVPPDAAPTTDAGATPTTTPGATTTLDGRAAATGPDVQRPAHAARPRTSPTAEVMAPGPPDRQRRPASCYLLGPTIAHRPQRLVRPRRSTTRTRRRRSPTSRSRTTTSSRRSRGPYVNKQVAIELDGVVQSAPTINPGITGRDVQISGRVHQGRGQRPRASCCGTARCPCSSTRTSRRSERLADARQGPAARRHRRRPHRPRRWSRST